MKRPHFKLDKWYLDVVNETGRALILYAAQLHWKGITVPYAAYLSYHPNKGLEHRSGFRPVQMPEVHDEHIYWKDHRFRIEGRWDGGEEPLSACLHNTEAGQLHWICHQPASQVELTLKGDKFSGSGYVEHLSLTALPWKIPMQELRWGRAHTKKGTLVWIDIRDKQPRQWVWFQGQLCPPCLIDDDKLLCEELKLELQLEPEMVLESGKTIGGVVDALTRYIPGFKTGATLNFLMADSYKWLSKAVLNVREERVHASPMAIHERVNFNAT